MRKRTRLFLYGLSDRLCSRSVTFELGNWTGELGWKLRES